MEILGTHTTSTGNQLEFYTVPSFPNSIFVNDRSCQIERGYKIGGTGILCWEDYDKADKADHTKITSFDQVMDAWKSEQIHF